MELDPIKAWEHQADTLIAEHFDAARLRVDDFAQDHLVNMPAVLRRHWQCRGDIPRDLANLPRSAWQLARRASGKSTNELPKPSKKMLVMAELIQFELLALPELELNLLELLQAHPALQDEQREALQQLEHTFQQFSPEQAQQRVHQAIERMTLAHEGSRDAVLFFTLGMIGKGVSDKIAFGSAAGLGASVASGIYLGQQTALGALWAKWFGLPGWVAASGAAGGIATMVLLTPVITPLFEVGINRVRSKRVLHKLIDEAEQRLDGSAHDAASLAGLAGTYLQVLPDFLQAVRAVT